MHLYKGLLELNPFNQAPRGCIKMLSLQVRTVYIGPGEVLLAQNDVINAIYYIASGSMEVLQGESVAAILGKCIYFTVSLSKLFQSLLPQYSLLESISKTIFKIRKYFPRFYRSLEKFKRMRNSVGPKASVSKEFSSSPKLMSSKFLWCDSWRGLRVNYHPHKSRANNLIVLV